MEIQTAWHTCGGNSSIIDLPCGGGVRKMCSFNFPGQQWQVHSWTPQSFNDQPPGRLGSLLIQKSYQNVEEAIARVLVRGTDAVNCVYR